MIAAAPGVESLGERGALLPWILPLLDMEPAAAADVRDSRAADLRQSDIAGMASLYPAATAFVDETPQHAHVPGLLRRIHPQAVFVDTRRSLVEVAISIYFHDFPPAFDYSRRLEDIVAYILFREQVLSRWRDAGVPIVIHEHERFVADPADAGRDLFEALDLAWNADYLQPSRRNATVQTFSQTQVRLEIGSGSADRGERYAAFAGDVLAPLRDR